MGASQVRSAELDIAKQVKLGHHDKLSSPLLLEHILLLLKHSPSLYSSDFRADAQSLPALCSEFRTALPE
jgi:hypothetical protein